jgi:hypothetical protein
MFNLDQCVVNAERFANEGWCCADGPAGSQGIRWSLIAVRARSTRRVNAASAKLGHAGTRARVECTSFSSRRADRPGIRVSSRE